MGEELRKLIRESFNDACIIGRVEVAKLYSEILLEIESQLQFLMEDD